MPEPLPIDPRPPRADHPERPRSRWLWLLPAVIVVWVVAVCWWVRDNVLRIAAHSSSYDVVARQKYAWNEGRLEDFMAEYWKSDDLTFFSGGTVTKGWQATLDRYRKRYQADGKEMGELTFDDIQVDVISTDAATVRGRWKVVTSKETAEGLFTLLVRRLDGRWVIVHDHTSAADPPKNP